MTKNTSICWCVFAIIGLLTSCLKEEPLNTECDIEVATIHLDSPEDVFYSVTDTMVRIPSTDSEVIFTVRRKADVSSLAPRFVLTPGATIVPENGSVQDFSHGPVKYVVTSEDKAWKREYQVSFKPMTRMMKDTLEIDFEDVESETKNGTYYIWKSRNEDGTLGNDWSTGNAGFYLSNSKAAPDDYPTTVLAEGRSGKGVKLVTRDTGTFGRWVKMPIAAGNLFLGKFIVESALLSALKATQFGIPFDKRPSKIEGYYKYQAGTQFIDKESKVIDKNDIADIYSVMYINHDAEGNPVYLYGDDVFTNSNIVAIARVSDLKNTDQWTHFEAEYVYQKEVDLDLLENYGYSFTIVFTSSITGASFEGAVGSTLCVDEVRVSFSKEE